jgi:hypothetical protein
MQVKSIPVEEIKQDPTNARKHGERNIETIKKSLQRFGQQKPIVISSDRIAIAGNGTLRAAVELGWKTIDAVETKLTGEDAAAFAIADNRTAELAQWDDEQLAVQLGAMEDELLDSAGFTQDEMIAAIAAFDGSPDEIVINDNSDYTMREHAAVKQIILTFTSEQYVPVIEGLVALRDKYKLDDFTQVFIRLMDDAGHEIP